MQLVLTILTASVGLVALVFSIVVMIETRKKYYKDYIKRKRNGKD